MNVHFQLLRRTPMLSGLCDETVEALGAKSVMRRLASGAKWISRRESAKGIALIVNGGLRSTTVTPEGREHVFSIMRKNDLWGIVSTIDGEPNANDVYAYGDTTLLTISRGVVLHVAEERADFSRCLLNILSHRLRMASALLEDRALQPLDVRMARLLLSMAGANVPAENSTAVRQQPSLVVTQETLRKLLGCSRPTVNQLLKRFEKSGLVRMEYGKLQLIDLAGIVHISGAAHHPYF